MATHEEHDSAISSLIVQVIFCVWLPVVGRSSTWPIKKRSVEQVFSPTLDLSSNVAIGQFKSKSKDNGQTPCKTGETED